MRITVCIKQVPGTAKVDIDEETGVLRRDGAEAKMNPYDLFALETALRLVEANGGEVTAITMGPMQAEAVIKEAYAMGAHRGVLLSDRAFAGSDVLATSYALSMGIRAAGEFDLIICGKQTTDGDTAQVGPETAEHLDIPHITGVTEVELRDGGIWALSDMGDYVQEQIVSLPCLITVDKDIYVPRLPSYKKMIGSRDREVRALTFKDLPGAERERLGLDGSPTKVEKIYPPENTREKMTLEGASGVYSKLAELKFLEAHNG